ncbi:hypothetical protein CANTEDRAFT_114802 [Yamadazyma tenuis ATCC 10573]|uniref:Uncharacterized protein n=1 Tax=Candida tenuis (strain ATCC 10573 / BCRC 21748 / CBS 615 / JCM 9827 / NBRC 10315 / NRRL Y-1498 / VKM Y-70) TaxID=590646 RepID=G3B6L7_CANTC|nr:uncharacterized protein CANTEDRAFT_114802 [Yamadazyma tenuis ATCC 10573]EGV63499.1 hypothetical protein CANTEDRAFT_114802 [Yamadazyma tenuis ATCC 10573]
MGVSGMSGVSGKYYHDAPHVKLRGKISKLISWSRRTRQLQAELMKANSDTFFGHC